jgi:nucleotide-binding universal stress UspA family protein
MPEPSGSRRIFGPMSTDVIVSYDGTANDDDALALGKRLATSGASLALAYVRHSREFDPGREELAQHDAEQRLSQGALRLGDPDVPQHIVISASTGEGLAKLAAEEGASLIVFGSDYRTPPGHAEPGTTAQSLLEGGPVAVGVAAAGLRVQTNGLISAIAVSAQDTDAAAHTTAEALAGKLGAQLVDPASGDPDLIVVGSQGAAPASRIALSGAARSMLNSSRASVIVVPNGTPVLA